MIIYIISFFISCILLQIASKMKKNNILYYIINGIAILIPCILAGLRNTTIGTDVEVYVRQLFNSAKISDNYFEYQHCSWWWIYRVKAVSDFEEAFTLVIFVVQKLTNNIQIVLFIIQLLIIFPIYCGLKKVDCIKNKKYLSMFVYYFSFFNIGLNTMRQYIAISIIFYGTSSLMYDKKYLGTIKFFISLAIAYYFHNSSVFCILIYLIYRILNFNDKKEIIIKVNNKVKIKLKTIVVVFSVFISIFLILNANIFIKVFSFLGIKDYTGWSSGQVTFMISKIIRTIPIVIIFIISGKYYIKQDKNSYMYIILFIMSVAFAQFASASTYGERMSYIFQIFNIVFVPSLCYANPNKNINIVVKIFIMLYYVLYWYYYFAYGNSGETVPYKFYWQ